MIRSALLATSLLAAGEAAALSCLRPDPLRSFREAQAAPEPFVVLYGRLSFDPAAMSSENEPPRAGLSPRGRDPVQARFDGYALEPDGFTRGVRARLVLLPICLGQFCGSIDPGENWLLFAQPSAEDVYTVLVAPCGSAAFDGASQVILENLAACLRGEACGAP